MEKLNRNDEEKKRLLVVQDMQIIEALAGNEKTVRERALKNLKQWLTHRNSLMEFDQDDYMRIWKGLFCTMWMSDKPLIQEECSENISQLIHHTSPQSALLFFKCGFTIMTMEWFGIDQWRFDKFLMLVRRMLRQAFVFLKGQEWNLKSVSEFVQILSGTVLNRDNRKFLGLTMHVTEIFLEELAKVSLGKIDQAVLMEFVKPFVKQLSTTADSRQIKHIVKHMFHHLMVQTDEGLEHEAKFDAWSTQGFPGGTLDVMEKMEVDSDEESEDDVDENVLDPRAGLVDVVLPQLKFDPQMILQMLSEFKFTKKSTTIGKNAITKLQQEFRKLSKGVYPLGITKVPLPEPDDFIEIEKSIGDLEEFVKDMRKNKSKSKPKESENHQIRKVVPKIKERRKPKLNGIDSTTTNLFAQQLQKFIDKSEGKLKKKKKVVPKKLNKSDLDWCYENSFSRNSGMWNVYQMNSSLSESPTTNGATPKKFTETNWSRPVKEGETEIFPSKKFNQTKLKGKSMSLIVNNTIGNARTLNLKNPFATTTPKCEKKVRIALKSNRTQEEHEHVAPLKSTPGIRMNSSLSESPMTNGASPKKFTETEWSRPLKEGETEIFIPSKKFNKTKLKGKSMSLIVNNTIGNARALNLKNPFATTTPKCEKKVRIALKLNRTQEEHEHVAQLKSSPGIPFDANRKPIKPLLKQNGIKSPINPFYKRKVKL